MDGLRGIAILFVLAVHWGTFVGGRFPGGYLGVDVFFVLSGYLITLKLLRRSQPWRSFMVDRSKRLMPALVVALVVGTLLAFTLPSRVSGLHAGRAALIAVLQGSSLIAPGHAGALEPFTMTWSLSTEWIFYAAWPLVLALVVRFFDGGRRTGAILLMGTAFYAASVFLPTLWFYFGPTARFGELLAGAGLASAIAGGASMKPPALAVWTGLAACVAWVCVGPAWDSTSPAYKLVGIPIAVAVTVAAILTGQGRADTSLLIRILQIRILVSIGRASYSLYLWHGLPLALFADDALNVSPFVLAGGSLTLVAVATAASYRWLEPHPKRADGGAVIVATPLCPTSAIPLPSQTNT